MSPEKLWIVLGMCGNALFFSRWIVQWVQSERAGQSVVPKTFWYLSIGGNLLLLAYALHLRDPVIIVSQLPNGIVYLRNLQLLNRAPKHRAP